ncbi:MAG: hypothetical protein R2843_05725 [Thermomicrobiales bacterium]
MKISKVETIVIGTNWRNLTVVKVSTDEGLVGLSEVRMVGHTGALIGYLKRGRRGSTFWASIRSKRKNSFAI